MKTAIYLLCFIFPAAVSAQTVSLIGDFTHGYTEPSNESVWTVQNTGDMWTVHSHGVRETFKARILNEAERKKYWEKLWWPITTATQADCLTYGEALICYVPKKAKIKIDWIENNKSDYFHYDAIGGVIEISLKQNNEIDAVKSNALKE